MSRRRELAARNISCSLLAPVQLLWDSQYLPLRNSCPRQPVGISSSIDPPDDRHRLEIYHRDVIVWRARDIRARAIRLNLNSSGASSDRNASDLAPVRDPD